MVLNIVSYLIGSWKKPKPIPQVFFYYQSKLFRWQLMTRSNTVWHAEIGSQSVLIIALSVGHVSLKWIIIAHGLEIASDITTSNTSSSFVSIKL
jgi:hypothetical protein